MTTRQDEFDRHYAVLETHRMELLAQGTRRQTANQIAASRKIWHALHAVLEDAGALQFSLSAYDSLWSWDLESNEITLSRAALAEDLRTVAKTSDRIVKLSELTVA